MALSAPGIGSSLDVNSIVQQLMAVEQRPLQALAQKEASYQAKLSAYGSIKSGVSAFKSAMEALTSTDKFISSRVTVSNKDALGVTANGQAVPGRYNIDIQALAQSQKLSSGNYAATTDTVGTGKLTIQFGSYSEADGSFTANADKAAKTIEIEPGNATLAGVRDAINAADAGVTATIINDGVGYRLVLAAKDTGLANAMRISVSDDGGSGLAALAYDASGDGPSNLTETVQARNAELTIDGIAISKASNTISDAIDGVTLNLLDQAEKTISVSITRDNSGTKTAVDNFVKAYNDLYGMLSNMSAYNAETKQAGVLQGDSTIRSMQTSLRTMMSTALDSAGGGLSRMSDIGVTIQVDGKLKVDSAKLQKAIDDPSKDIATLFASIAKPSDSLVSFVSAGADAKAGTHALEITQLATQGRAEGSQAAATAITAGVNDKLMLEIDGVKATITLNAGTYTATSLAAELQSKINGAAELRDNDVSVEVTESGGVLTITSERYGSASKVQITGGNARTGLFGSVTSTDGVDVAGTMGGQAATGSGRKLTGLGISLDITGGALGPRGTISFAQGFAERFVNLAERFLADDGVLDARQDGLNRSIKDIADRRDAFNLRLETIEKRYRAQFTALDVMIASMQQTSSYLQQQLASLPKIGGE
ncbi:MAG TPA: flagellar filament capping protein FliD [Burkholderiales bacterium]|nr:flagellar filament capping protein FliD [Burkholderiales bacterium]